MYAVVSLFDVHIAEPDVQHPIDPIIDDPDDVFAGVSGAALCRGSSGVGLSGLLGLCRRGGRDAEGGFGGLLLRLRVYRVELVHHILLGVLCGVVRGICRGVLCGVDRGVCRGVVRGVRRGVLALLLFLAQGKVCVRVRLALPGSRPGCFQLLRISAILVRDCFLCSFSFNTFFLLLGSALLVEAVLDHDLVAGVGIGVIPLFHLYILAVLIRYGRYVNAAVADIINIRKGRGCNRSNNRHNCCRRQHPQSQIFSLHNTLFLSSLSQGVGSAAAEHPGRLRMAGFARGAAPV